MSHAFARYRQSFSDLAGHRCSWPRGCPNTGDPRRPHAGIPSRGCNVANVVSGVSGVSVANVANIANAANAANATNAANAANAGVDGSAEDCRL